MLLLLGAEDGLLRTRRMAATLGITLETLAALLRVNKNSVSGDGPGATVQTRMSEVARILSRAAGLMENGDGGEAGRAVLWFRNQPLVGFGGLTAMELVGEGKSKAVMEHLGRLEDGGYA